MCTHASTQTHTNTHVDSHGKKKEERRKKKEERRNGIGFDVTRVDLTRVS